MRIHSIFKRSAVNGPGWRYTIWFQGCSILCPGCANKHIQPFTGGTETTCEDLLKDIRLQGESIEGITLTGGEPLDQDHKELVDLCTKIFPDYSVFLTSGYTLESIKDQCPLLLNVVDILVDGPFVEGLLDTTNAWRGSTNQTIHYLTDRGRIYQGMDPKYGCELRFEGNKLVATGFNVPKFIKEGM
jgi:anaerobic ribonucleoside-triphosphate reductase activating protein